MCHYCPILTCITVIMSLFLERHSCWIMIFLWINWNHHVLGPRIRSPHKPSLKYTLFQMHLMKVEHQMAAKPQCFSLLPPTSKYCIKFWICNTVSNFSSSWLLRPEWFEMGRYHCRKRKNKLLSFLLVWEMGWELGYITLGLQRVALQTQNYVVVRIGSQGTRISCLCHPISFSLLSLFSTEFCRSTESHSYPRC